MIPYSEGYVKKDGKWCFQVVGGDCGGELSYVEIAGIDTVSFEILEYQPWKWSNSKHKTDYAKDKNAVYYRGERVKGADPKSTKILKGWEGNQQYIKDINAIYFRGKRIAGNADPLTFRMLDENNSNYAIDRFGLYYNGTPLMYSSSKNYRILEATRPWNFVYAISNNRVFYQENEIKGANAATFKIVQNIGDYNRYYSIAKDKNHVYIDGQALSKIDTKTFEIVTVDFSFKKMPGGCSNVEPYYYRTVLTVIIKDKNGTYRVEHDGKNHVEEGTFYLVDPCTPRKIDATREKVDNETYYCSPPIYTIVQQKPQFQGDSTLLKFREYITTQINYPIDAKKDNIQGRVIIEFVIDGDGLICNTNVVRGLHPSIDKEALRIINSSPKWTPGILNGEFVKTKETILVIFKLP
jgi:TonB family protein